MIFVGANIHKGSFAVIKDDGNVLEAFRSNLPSMSDCVQKLGGSWDIRVVDESFEISGLGCA
ncbi:MAG: hypothetical protein QXU67_05540 [Candidatus Bathyarchaeia archaeon]